jgi:hypothetical protein
MTAEEARRRCEPASTGAYKRCEGQRRYELASTGAIRGSERREASGADGCEAPEACGVAEADGAFKYGI